MYPFIRLYSGLARAKRQPKIGIFEASEVSLRVWPLDIDIWMELNNGRTLTLYDLARLPHFQRSGLIDQLGRAGMFATVAGVSVRYRERVMPFSKVRVRTQTRGWDDRFLYIEQSMWMGDKCANNVVIRQAIARRGKGIVPPKEVAGILGVAPESPDLPEWIENWSKAEATRPWPPVIDG